MFVRRRSWLNGRDPITLTQGGAMARLFSIDVFLAVIGTLAAAASVIINQQWLPEKRDAVTLLLDTQSANRYQIVQLEDTKREAVRLRDLNMLYGMLRYQTMDAASRTMILDQAISAYETALISMARHEPSEQFDATGFKIENLATAARGDDMAALQGLAGEFIRLFQIVDQKRQAFGEDQRTVSGSIADLRSAADQFAAISAYLQVFGLILVMLATIVGLKRIELCLQ